MRGTPRRRAALSCADAAWRGLLAPPLDRVDSVLARKLPGMQRSSTLIVRVTGDVKRASGEGDESRSLMPEQPIQGRNEAATTVSESRHRPWIGAVLSAVIVVAVAIPLIQLARELRHATPNAFVFDEDAYYYFSIARNFVSGHGITADGHHATSGFQALWSFVLLGPFLFYRHMRVTLALVGVESLACWLWAASSFSALLADLVPRPFLSRRDTRLLFVTVFLLSRTVRVLSFNGLETGLYLAVLLHVARTYVFGRHARDSSDVGFAVWLALLALARSDAIVLVVGLIASRAWLHRRAAWRQVVLWPLAAASIALLPQVVWNLWVADSPLPQSGVALSPPVLSFGFGEKVHLAYQTIPAAVLWPFVPTGHHLTPDRLGVIALVVAVLEIALICGSGLDRSRLVVLGGLGTLSLAICAAYVLKSSAPYFYVRYFAPLELFGLGLTAVAIWRVVDLVASRRWRRPTRTLQVFFALALSVVPLLLIVGSEPRGISPGYMGPELLSLSAHHEFDRCTVGMFESGRIGYAYPDRVVNLDGVVNAPALRALLDSRLAAYLTAAHVDVIYMHTFDISLFVDRKMPGWQRDWTLVRDPNLHEAGFLVRDGATCVTGSAGLRP